MAVEQKKKTKTKTKKEQKHTAKRIPVFNTAHWKKGEKQPPKNLLA